LSSVDVERHKREADMSHQHHKRSPRPGGWRRPLSSSAHQGPCWPCGHPILWPAL